jgi:alpha-galactosidase
LDTGPLVPTRDYHGAARLPTKTVEEMEAKAEENRKLAAESDKAKERPAAL